MRIDRYKNEKFNYPSHTKELFEAMKEGKTIVEIIFIDKVYKQSNIESIKNFKASDYYVATQTNYDITEKYDLVSGTSNGFTEQFYMSWVKDFKIE